jgi:hypothetical protein
MQVDPQTGAVQQIRLMGHMPEVDMDAGAPKAE